METNDTEINGSSTDTSYSYAAASTTDIAHESGNTEPGESYNESSGRYEYNTSIFGDNEPGSDGVETTTTETQNNFSENFDEKSSSELLKSENTKVDSSNISNDTPNTVNESVLDTKIDVSTKTKDEDENKSIHDDYEHNLVNNATKYSEQPEQPKPSFDAFSYAQGNTDYRPANYTVNSIGNTNIAQNANASMAENSGVLKGNTGAASGNVSTKGENAINADANKASKQATGFENTGKTDNQKELENRINTLQEDIKTAEGIKADIDKQFTEQTGIPYKSITTEEKISILQTQRETVKADIEETKDKINTINELKNDPRYSSLSDEKKAETEKNLNFLEKDYLPEQLNKLETYNNLIKDYTDVDNRIQTDKDLIEEHGGTLEESSSSRDLKYSETYINAIDEESLNNFINHSGISKESINTIINLTPENYQDNASKAQATYNEISNYLNKSSEELKKAATEEDKEKILNSMKTAVDLLEKGTSVGKDYLNIGGVVDRAKEILENPKDYPSRKVIAAENIVKNASSNFLKDPAAQAAFVADTALQGAKLQYAKSLSVAGRKEELREYIQSEQYKAVADFNKTFNTDYKPVQPAAHFAMENKGVYNPTKGGISNIFNAIREITSAFGSSKGLMKDGIQNKVSEWSDKIKENINKTIESKGLNKVWDNIKNYTGNILSSVLDIVNKPISGAFNLAKALTAPAFDAVNFAFDAILPEQWNGIKDYVKGFSTAFKDDLKYGKEKFIDPIITAIFGAGKDAKVEDQMKALNSLGTRKTAGLVAALTGGVASVFGGLITGNLGLVYGGYNQMKTAYWLAAGDVSPENLANYIDTFLGLTQEVEKIILVEGSESTEETPLNEVKKKKKDLGKDVDINTVEDNLEGWNAGRGQQYIAENEAFRNFVESL